MENGSAEDKPTESQHDDNVGILEDSHSYQVELITQMSYFIIFSSFSTINTYILDFLHLRCTFFGLIKNLFMLIKVMTH